MKHTNWTKHVAKQMVEAEQHLRRVCLVNIQPDFDAGAGTPADDAGAGTPDFGGAGAASSAGADDGFAGRTPTTRTCDVCDEVGPWTACNCQHDRWLAAARGWHVQGVQVLCPECMGASKKSKIQSERALREFVCRLCVDEATPEGAARRFQ